MSLELGEIRNPQELWPKIYAQLDGLPLSRASLYTQLGFSQSSISLWKKLSQADIQLEINEGVLDLELIAELLANQRLQAQDLEDKRAESYALGYLGNLYEQKPTVV